MSLGLAKIGLALALYPQVLFVYEFVANTLSWGVGIVGFGLLLLTCGLSTNPVHGHLHVFICLAGASAPFLGFISNKYLHLVKEAF